jgi:transcriptional regulator with XRE-family HTH domain
MKDELHDKIGKKIKSLREFRGETKLELAKVLGYESDTAVHLIEEGKRKLSLEKLKIIAEHYQVPVSEIVEPDIEQERVDVFTALRSDGTLTQKDVDQISSFIDFIKSEAKKK